jgi:hypothetical protein
VVGEISVIVGEVLARLDLHIDQVKENTAATATASEDDDGTATAGTATATIDNKGDKDGKSE